MIESIKLSLQHQLAKHLETLKDKTIFEVVIIVMSEVEKMKYLSGAEKQEYCIDAVLNTCKIDVDPALVKLVIKNVIDLTHGAFKINVSDEKRHFLCF